MLLRQPVKVVAPVFVDSLVRPLKGPDVSDPKLRVRLQVDPVRVSTRNVSAVSDAHQGFDIAPKIGHHSSFQR